MRKGDLTNMGTQRRTYSAEYKREALRLIEEQGMSKAQVARDLGIRDNLLSKWQKQLEAQGGKAFPGHGNPTEQELARLRRENEVLRREREILKKAVSIFSQQQP